MLALSLALKAAFIITCAPTSLQCSFDASTSIGPPAAYVWDWGNGRTETHVSPLARNTFTPGTYCIKLTVRDSTGTNTVEQLVTIPLTATRFGPCSQQKPDTVTITLPARVDTVKVQVPGPAVHDTVTIYIMRPPVPPNTPGRVVVEPTPGEYLVYDNGVLKGLLVAITPTQWQAYQYTLGQMSMPCLGLPNFCNVYSSQAAARDALP